MLITNFLPPARLHANTEEIMQDQSDVRALIEKLESQSRCDPTDFMARYNLGVAYDSLCLSEKAVAAYRSAIRIEPNGSRNRAGPAAG